MLELQEYLTLIEVEQKCIKVKEMRVPEAHCISSFD